MPVIVSITTMKYTMENGNWPYFILIDDDCRGLLMLAVISLTISQTPQEWIIQLVMAIIWPTEYWLVSFDWHDIVSPSATGAQCEENALFADRDTIFGKETLKMAPRAAYRLTCKRRCSTPFDDCWLEPDKQELTDLLPPSERWSNCVCQIPMWRIIFK